MAIFYPGPLATDIYGSVGGITFSVAAGMHIIKVKPIPRQRIIPERVILRNRFSEAIYNWKNIISDANRTAWNNGAAAFTQSRHGIAYDITGFNLQAAHRTLMQIAGLAPIVAPLVFTGRENKVAITWLWNGGVGKLRGTWNPAPYNPNHELLLWWTDGNRPSATIRRTGFTHSGHLRANLGTYDLDATYTPSPGVLFIHWILLYRLGTLSSTTDTHESYP